jgi:hypothetical protein
MVGGTGTVTGDRRRWRRARGPIHGLHPDDPAPGSQRSGGDRAPGQQTAAPRQTTARRAGRALDQLERHRALSGDHERVVVGVDDVEAEPLRRLGRDLLPVLRVAVEPQHLGPVALGGRHLAGRRVLGHQDDGLGVVELGRQRDGLAVVPRRGREHAAGAHLRIERGHVVVRAAELEGPDALQVLGLEVELRARALVQRARA